MKNFIKEFVARFTNMDVPAFFKKIQILGGSIAAVGTSIKVIPGEPGTLIHTASYMITVGLTMVAIGQLANNNPPAPKS